MSGFVYGLNESNEFNIVVSERLEYWEVSKNNCAIIPKTENIKNY